MKRLGTALLAVLMMGVLLAGMASSETMSIGKFRLSYTNLDIDLAKQQYTASGNPVLETPNGTVKAGRIFVDMAKQTVIARPNASLTTPDTIVKAEAMQFDITKAQGGAYDISKATATGGVTVHARRTGSAGQSRVVDTSSSSAVYDRTNDELVLNGNVTVKITDPSLAEPAVLTGEKVTYYLKQEVIRIAGSTEKQGELVITPKETER